MAGQERSIVLIHDGVRPMIYKKTIDDNLQSVREHGSAITSVTVKETVLVVSEDNAIVDVPNRKIQDWPEHRRVFTWMKL